VFIGRSLPPHVEGQTPIEAAILGKPMIFGSGMANFPEVAPALVRAGAARAVRGAAELCSAGVELLRDGAARAAMAAHAEGWRSANQGAVRRTVDLLEKELATFGLRRA
jgi:3-deoxy-D-manno-octulosonic-acid transferase